MFANEENHKKEAKSELAKEVKGWYEEYLKSDDFLTYCNIERDRMVIRSRISEGRQEGIELGKEQGIELGKQESCREMIKEKYQVHDLEWLKICTDAQLDKIPKLIFKELTYEEFKSRILIKGN